MFGNLVIPVSAKEGCTHAGGTHRPGDYSSGGPDWNYCSWVIMPVIWKCCGEVAYTEELHHVSHPGWKLGGVTGIVCTSCGFNRPD